MIDNGLSADQVRAKAGCTHTEAQAACYMSSAASDGWTLADFQDRTRLGAVAARGMAFRFGVEFNDYDPFSKGKRLAWRKVKSGWELRDGETVHGRCQRSDGKYHADGFGVSESAWDGRTAMRMASEKIDALSPELFGGRLVSFTSQDAEGKFEGYVFPIITDEVQSCRNALVREAA